MSPRRALSRSAGAGLRPAGGGDHPARARRAARGRPGRRRRDRSALGRHPRGQTRPDTRAADLGLGTPSSRAPSGTRLGADPGVVRPAHSAVRRGRPGSSRRCARSSARWRPGCRAGWAPGSTAPVVWCPVGQDVVAGQPGFGRAWRRSNAVVTTSVQGQCRASRSQRRRPVVTSCAAVENTAAAGVWAPSRGCRRSGRAWASRPAGRGRSGRSPARYGSGRCHAGAGCAGRLRHPLRPAGGEGRAGHRREPGGPARRTGRDGVITLTASLNAAGGASARSAADPPSIVCVAKGALSSTPCGRCVHIVGRAFVIRTIVDGTPRCTAQLVS